jgi:maltose alpha-D-glucosyltransferase / alpha-amylase
VIDDLWYKNDVIHCLSVGTNMDANGDGIGDFKGLLRRLHYLQGLGITTIWLMPFQPSPGKDDGYDISVLLWRRSAVRHAGNLNCRFWFPM